MDTEADTTSSLNTLLTPYKRDSDSPSCCWRPEPEGGGKTLRGGGPGPGMPAALRERPKPRPNGEKGEREAGTGTTAAGAGRSVREMKGLGRREGEQSAPTRGDRVWAETPHHYHEGQ